MTKTPEAEALREIEAEQQAANDALVTDSVAKVEKAAVAMLAAAEQAYKGVEASVARANALRGTDANVPATEAPIADRVPIDSRFREGGAEDQALNPVPVASNAGPGADFGGFANVEDRVSLRSRPKPASGPSSGVPRTGNPQIDSILDSMDAGGPSSLSPEKIQSMITLPDRVATGNVRPNTGAGAGTAAGGTSSGGSAINEPASRLAPEDIDITATIGDFQINLMGTENAIGQLQNAVVSVALEQIQQQLPALIEEQQAKIKGQV